MKKFILFIFLMQATMSFATHYSENYDFYVTNDDGKEIYYKITSSVEPHTVEVTYQYYTSGFPSIISPYAGEINIPESVLYNGQRYTVTAIGEDAFINCINLTSVSIPNSVEILKSGAFYLCDGLTDIVIPERVKEIGDNAFMGCDKITKLTISESVVSIGDYAFSGCPIEELIFNAVNCSGPISGMVFRGAKFKYVTIGNSVTAIPSSFLSGCTGLTTVALPESIKSIGSGAFKGCISLQSVSLSESLMTIGQNAFLGAGLVSVDLPNTLSDIGAYAFKDCAGLTSVTIPASVSNIGNDAFSGCTELTTVNFNAANCSTMNADNSYYVFKNCNKLSVLNIGDNVKNIPEYAFYNCTALKGNLLLPNSLENIGRYAFYNCGILESVSIGESVKTIGSGAFGKCTGLSRVLYQAKNALSAGATDNPVFNGCINIDLIDISADVESIPQYTFKGCENVTKVYSRSGNPSALQAITTFDPYNYFATLYIPGGSKEKYQSADYWKRFSDIVETDFSGIRDNVIGDSDISVYISSGVLNITGVEGDTAVQIYNASGALLYSTVVDRLGSLNLSRGIYIVKVGGYTTKIIK